MRFCGIFPKNCPSRAGQRDLTDSTVLRNMGVALGLYACSHTIPY
jgi:hypothetical protein